MRKARPNDTRDHLTLLKETAKKFLHSKDKVQSRKRGLEGKIPITVMRRTSSWKNVIIFKEENNKDFFLNYYVQSAQIHKMICTQIQHKGYLECRHHVTWHCFVFFTWSKPCKEKGGSFVKIFLVPFRVGLKNQATLSSTLIGLAFYPNNLKTEKYQVTQR